MHDILEPPQDGFEIRIASDGRVWINGPEGCLVRINRMKDPSKIKVHDERKFSVRQGVPDFVGQKSEEAITHSAGSLGFCSCGHPMTIHEDGVCPVCTDGSFKVPCES